MSFVIEARGLVAGYAGRTVLHGVDLALSPGERVVLLGPNGSGKSTLLKALSKGLAPTQGTVSLLGDDIGRLSHAEVARRLAFVPQEETARFSFRVREVVTMGRLARSNGLFDTPEDREVAKRAMERADCLHLAERPYTELSGGERQRVLIARALAQEGRVVLLDEPTSHLDPAHQVAVAELVGSLAAEGVATVAAVHDLNLASRMAARAVLMREGHVALDGPVETVLRSETLDYVYGVPFARVEAPGGRLALLPGLSS
ncbi:MAG: ABC transporter ATP-binding protein [Fimbriimonas sp.]